MADNWKFESKFNRAYGFNRTDGFSGHNIWDSRNDYMSDDYMDDWEKWTKTAYSETSRNIDRKHRDNGKKGKKSNKGKKSKKDSGSEFYAKLRKHGSTVIEIDGDKFKVQLKNGIYSINLIVFHLRVNSKKKIFLFLFTMAFILPWRLIELNLKLCKVIFSTSGRKPKPEMDLPHTNRISHAGC